MNECWVFTNAFIFLIPFWVGSVFLGVLLSGSLIVTGEDFVSGILYALLSTENRLLAIPPFTFPVEGHSGRVIYINYYVKNIMTSVDPPGIAMAFDPRLPAMASSSSSSSGW